MSIVRPDGIEGRFDAYVSSLSEVIGHADRAGPLRDYCMGLVLPGERKSVEPMAAVTAPSRVAAQHQSLLHFVGASPWSDERMLEKVRERVQPALERHGPIEAWIIDDTGFPKKGRHSVGVARQYCGQLGKQDNCQVAVSLSIANHGASLPISFRLYLPQEWAADAERRGKTGVPEEIAFRTKPEIALSQLRAALAADIPRGVVLLDAGYGNNTHLRTEISALGLPYVAGILSSTSVRTVDDGKKHGTAKRRRRRLRRPIRRSRSKISPTACLRRPGKPSLGAKARPTGSNPASPAFVFEPHTVIPPPRTNAASRNGCSSSGPHRNEIPPNIGSRPCPRTSPSTGWSTAPSCAGASSATIRSSSRRSVSVTMKDEVGAAFTITPRSASPPTVSSSPNGRRFPPQHHVPPRSSRNLPFPKIIDPAALPIRTQRHIPNSIATMRHLLIAALARRLARCPCCAVPRQKIPAKLRL